MTAIRSHHARVFEQLISAHRASLAEALILRPPGDYAAYRQIVGQIQGLADALKISEEADFKLNGDEPNVGV